MIIRHKGFLIVMSVNPDPRNVNGPRVASHLFGPSTSQGLTYQSENIQTNGLEVFTHYHDFKRALRERRGVFGREWHLSGVEAELHIAESIHDCEALRDFGSYVVAVGMELSDCQLFGTCWVDGRRVPGSHDSWCGFYHNGLTPFTNFPHVMGETSLGPLPELSRQAQERARLVGVRMNW